jgi:aspartate aminotransferase-like enzyme
MEPGRLMTPGPTPIPPEVEAAMSQPILYHRGPEFQATLERVLEKLGLVCRSSSPIALFTASGTGAMESAVANLVSPGQRVLVVSAGHFGERWAQLVSRYGGAIEHLRFDWGATPDPDEVAACLRRTGAPLVFCTHSETSTGVVSDVRAIAERVKAAGALLVVDAISSLGAVPLEQDAWGVDVVVSGSQKALMTPPGLGLASISAAALEASRDSTAPRYYFDWERTVKAQAELRNAFTPAVSLVCGLDIALDLLLADGVEAAWRRSAQLARACRAGVKAMGLELFSPDEDRSAVVTAIQVPAGIDGGAVVRGAQANGVTLAGGQGELRGKILRIGHIGYVGIDDVAAALAAIEDAFATAGADVERGRAANRAREVYADAASVGAGVATPDPA